MYGNPGKLWIRAQRGCSVQNWKEIVKLNRIQPILKFTIKLYKFSQCTSIQKLNYLTALELTFANAITPGFTIPTYLELVCKGLPNLKESILNFSFQSLLPKLRFDAITQPFIASLPKLKAFRINAVDDRIITCDENDLNVLNAARSTLMVSLNYSYINGSE